MPGIVIMGAQKAGTTSLHAALLQHPSVVPAVDPVAGAEVKELHFFSDDGRWSRGPEWYGSHFAGTGIGIEATPNYLSTPAAHARLAATLPSARAVVVLREPAARAYSQYNHYVQARPASDGFDWVLPGESFEANLRAELGGALAGRPYRGLVARGRYADQLESLGAHLPSDRVHIVIFERLVRNPVEELTRLVAELDLPPAALDLPALHKRWYAEPEPPPLTRGLLDRHFESHNRRLRTLLDDRIPEWR